MKYIEDSSLLNKKYRLLNSGDLDMVRKYEKYLGSIPTSPEIISELEKIGIHVSSDISEMSSYIVERISKEIIFDKMGRVGVYVEERDYNDAKEFYENSRK